MVQYLFYKYSRHFLSSSIQFSFICEAPLTVDIVIKRLYRNLDVDLDPGWSSNSDDTKLPKMTQGR